MNAVTGRENSNCGGLINPLSGSLAPSVARSLDFKNVPKSKAQMSKGHGLVKRTYRQNGEIREWWTFVYWHPIKKRNIRLQKKDFPTNIKTEHEAVEFKKAFLGKLNSLKAKIQKVEEWKNRYHDFEVLLSGFEKDRRRRSPNNWQRDVYFLSRYVFNFYLTLNSENNISRWHFLFDDFRDHLEIVKPLKVSTRKVLAYSTKNHCIKALNNFLTFVYRKNKMGSPPKCSVFEKNLLNRKGAESLIPKDEEQYIYNKLDGEFHLSAKFWRTLYNTAVRQNEGFGLSLADIYVGAPKNESLVRAFARYSLHCHGHIVLESQPKLSQIRDADGTVPRKPLKSKKKIEPKNNRIIPILNKETWLILVSLLKVQRENWKNKKYGNDKKNYLLFDGLNKSIFANDLRKAYEGTKFKRHTAHDCRHTFCTEFGGMTEGNQFLCQNVLGHKDSKTNDHYFHLWENIQLKMKTDSMLEDDSWLDKIDVG